MVQHHPIIDKLATRLTRLIFFPAAPTSLDSLLFFCHTNVSISILFNPQIYFQKTQLVFFFMYEGKSDMWSRWRLFISFNSWSKFCEINSPKISSSFKLRLDAMPPGPKVIVSFQCSRATFPVKGLWNNSLRWLFLHFMMTLWIIIACHHLCWFCLFSYCSIQTCIQILFKICF